ncbi:hypothetical protein Pmani_012708 [Petrolisthes manimaculis]|uniref:Uncharacterized protein n=1 Tax=Petrolisthes manimaculis TaxID=1843537 RepID=A0AAE1UEV2_9EUCA|nr:hypothetical protein Pmani_012708 [Petrolisthes manimaculis]
MSHSGSHGQPYYTCMSLWLSRACEDDVTLTCLFAVSDCPLWVRQNTYLMLIKRHRNKTHNIQKAEMVGVERNLVAEDHTKGHIDGGFHRLSELVTTHRHYQTTLNLPYHPTLDENYPTH